MENWRKSIVEVLRECNGESNLEELVTKGRVIFIMETYNL